MSFRKFVQFESKVFAADGVVVKSPDDGRATVLNKLEFQVLQQLDGSRSENEVFLGLSGVSEAEFAQILDKLEQERLLPGARMPLKSPELFEELVGDELVIYNQKQRKAYCLNKTSALVFSKCDGRTPVDEVVRLLEDAGLEGNGHDILAIALTELRAQGLIPPQTLIGTTPPSRRDFLKAVAGVALAAPMLSALTLPSPAQAVSCVATAACVSHPATNCNKVCVPCTNSTYRCVAYSIQLSNKKVINHDNSGCTNVNQSPYNGRVVQNCKSGCTQYATGIVDYFCCSNPPLRSIPIGSKGCSYCSGVGSKNLCVTGATSCKSSTCH